MSEMRFYPSLPQSKKRAVRTALDDIERNTKEEKDRLLELYIKPMNDRLELIKKARKGDISIEHLIKRTEAITKYLKEAMGVD